MEPCVGPHDSAVGSLRIGDLYAVLHCSTQLFLFSHGACSIVQAGAVWYYLWSQRALLLLLCTAEF